MQIFVDAGGTHLRWIERDDEKESYYEHPSSELDLLAMLDGRLSATKNVEFVGVSFAGQVQDGRILSSPNLKTEPIDFEGYIREKHGVRAKIQNDLKCAALAEQSIRPHAHSLALMFIGTGLGGALTQQGALITGATNLAGEIGHIPFRPCDAVCGCGQNDCVELYASSSGLKKQAVLAGLPRELGRLDRLEESNDERAKQIVELFYAALSHAAKTVATLFDPDTIVFGGGIALANPHIADFVRKELKGRSLGSGAKVELSTLGNASLAGARLLC